jgi:FKBP-type peptidyl-prolyl cis-trans isomerase FkpA
LILILLQSCNKEDKRADEEIVKLQQYLEQMGYTDLEPTNSGLYFVVLQPAEGVSPVRSDYININFTGRLVDGTIFDTSDRALAVANNIERDNKIYGPHKFLLETMSIMGFREGLMMMKEGEIARIIIPSHLAFGRNQIGLISPYSTLIYDVELIDVINDPIEHEKKLIETYLQENGIETEPENSGLYYIESQAGSGNQPALDSKVALHYQGALIDGRVFDRSETGIAWTLDLNFASNYIPGFIEGIRKMRIGTKARFIIPSDIGFGPTGSSEGMIPPYSTLVFDVEVVNIY